MNLLEIQKEVESLDHRDQRKLMGFLVSLRLQREEEWKDRMARKLDDKTPGRWIPIESVEKELGFETGNGE